MFLTTLFPCLLVACLGLIAYVLKLWGKSLVVPTIVSSPLLLLMYFYSGIHIGESEALPKLRQLFLTHVLHDARTLFGLCVALSLLLASALVCGIQSETLSFISDNEVEVFQVVGKEHPRDKPLRFASLQKPLVRRCFSGARRFKFKSEGFEPEVRSVPVRRSWMSGRERRIPIELVLQPEFELLDFETRAEVFDSPNDGILPAHLRSWPGATLRLTLATVSKASLRVQNLRLIVEDVQPLKKTTFPVDGLGGDGDPPLLGYVQLSPQTGTCEVVVNKTTQGAGAKPQDYLVLAVSRPGYRYRVRAQLRWTDARDPRRGGEHLFDEAQVVEFPKVVPWEEMVKGASCVRVFFHSNGDWWLLSHMTTTLLAMQPPPQCFALLGAQEGLSWQRRTPNQFEQERREHAAGFEAVNEVQESRQADLARLVGKTYGHAREFILIDEHTLLVQDPEDLKLAQIITDSQIIEATVKVFDSLLS